MTRCLTTSTTSMIFANRLVAASWFGPFSSSRRRASTPDNPAGDVPSERSRSASARAGLAERGWRGGTMSATRECEARASGKQLVLKKLLVGEDSRAGGVSNNEAGALHGTWRVQAPGRAPVGDHGDPRPQQLRAYRRVAQILRTRERELDVWHSRCNSPLPEDPMNCLGFGFVTALSWVSSSC